MEKVIIIGSSKGIGRATLDLLVTNYEVFGITRNPSNFSHPNYTEHNLDILTDEIPHIENINHLIYTPGSINLKPFNRLKEIDFLNDFNINVLGAVRSIQFYLPEIKKSNNSSITLFSTVATKLGMPFHASIAASKSALEGVVISLAAELASSVRVNAIAPTITDTPLASGLLRNDEAIERMKQRHPTKEIINPSEIANIINMLISPLSKNITGQILKIDAGITTLKL